jgi:hypothetical protein
MQCFLTLRPLEKSTKYKTENGRGARKRKKKQETKYKILSNYHLTCVNTLAI